MVCFRIIFLLGCIFSLFSFSMSTDFPGDSLKGCKSPGMTNLICLPENPKTRSMESSVYKDSEGRSNGEEDDGSQFNWSVLIQIDKQSEFVRKLLNSLIGNYNKALALKTLKKEELNPPKNASSFYEILKQKINQDNPKINEYNAELDKICLLFFQAPKPKL